MIAELERGITLEQSPFRYQNDSYDLDLVTDGVGLRSQRAFGYFDRTPSIIPRVVNESAEVADALNARGP